MAALDDNLLAQLKRKRESAETGAKRTAEYAGKRKRPVGDTTGAQSQGAAKTEPAAPTTTTTAAKARKSAKGTTAPKPVKATKVKKHDEPTKQEPEPVSPAPASDQPPSAAPSPHLEPRSTHRSSVSPKRQSIIWVGAPLLARVVKARQVTGLTNGELIQGVVILAKKDKADLAGHLEEVLAQLENRSDDAMPRKGPERKPLNFSLREGQFAELDVLAVELGATDRSDLVRQALDLYLSQLQDHYSQPRRPSL